MTIRRFLGAAALAAGLAGCRAEPADVERAQEPIFGGARDPAHRAVGLVSIRYPDGRWAFGSGALISPRVVLTAGHVAADRERGAALEVSFDDTVSAPLSGDGLAVVEHAIHPDYASAAAGTVNDVALLLLAEAPGIEPVPVRRAPLDPSWLGRELTLVGYGLTEAERTDFGAIRDRRSVAAPIAGYVARDVYLDQHGGGGVCGGDSGGPWLGALDGVEEILAVTSMNAQDPDGYLCYLGGYSRGARVDVYLEGFVDLWVAAWDPPTCAGGDSCAAGCARLDPDCVPGCRANGACVEGCHDLDPDCPRLELGERCARAGDCASGACEPADDDPARSFCVGACAEGGACPAGMECDRTDTCRWPLPSPGTLGGRCADSADCATGPCVTRGDVQVCSSLCDPAASSSCPDGYSCEPAHGGASLCLAAAGDGGCAVTPRGRAGLAAAPLLLAALVLLARRRACRDAGPPPRPRRRNVVVRRDGGASPG